MLRLCRKCRVRPLGYGVDYNIVFEDSMGYAYQCPNCNRGTDWYRTEIEAQNAWNEMNDHAP